MKAAYPGAPLYEHPIFQKTVDQLVSEAVKFLESRQWQRIVTDNQTCHPDTVFAQAINPELIHKYAEFPVNSGARYFGIMEASEKLVLGENKLGILLNELDMLKAASTRCLDLYGEIAPLNQLFLGSERAALLDQVLQTVVREANRATELATRPEAKGFTVAAAPGLGLDDTGLLVTGWIARFRSTDPNYRPHIFALGCAWSLFRARNKNRDTPSWGSFNRQFRRWSKHPLAADTDADKAAENTFSMSAAAIDSRAKLEIRAR